MKGIVTSPAPGGGVLATVLAMSQSWTRRQATTFLGFQILSWLDTGQWRHWSRNVGEHYSWFRSGLKSRVKLKTKNERKVRNRSTEICSNDRHSSPIRVTCHVCYLEELPQPSIYWLAFRLMSAVERTNMANVVLPLSNTNDCPTLIIKSTIWSVFWVFPRRSWYIWYVVALPASWQLTILTKKFRISLKNTA